MNYDLTELFKQIKRVSDISNDVCLYEDGRRAIVSRDDEGVRRVLQEMINRFRNTINQLTAISNVYVVENVELPIDGAYASLLYLLDSFTYYICWEYGRDKLMEFIMNELSN